MHERKTRSGCRIAQRLLPRGRSFRPYVKIDDAAWRFPWTFATDRPSILFCACERDTVLWYRLDVPGALRARGDAPAIWLRHRECPLLLSVRPHEGAAKFRCGRRRDRQARFIFG